MGSELNSRQGKPKALYGTEIDPASLTQLDRCLGDERAVYGALMADHHKGYAVPIGGVIAYQEAISPSGVGFDIACGNKAILTDASSEVLPIMLASPPHWCRTFGTLADGGA